MRVMNDKIKDLREDNDITQEKIAKFLNTERSTYSNWENGHFDMPLDKCNELANYYHVTIDYLLGLSNNHKYVEDSKDIDWAILSERLKKEIKSKNFSQSYVGKKIGFPQVTYSNFERGFRKPTTFKLLIIAQFYNVSMDYLVGRCDNYMID